MSVSVCGKSEYGMDEVIKRDEAFQRWVRCLASEHATTRPLGYLVPKVLTLRTGLAHIVPVHFYTFTSASIRFLQHYSAVGLFILCACVFICAFLSIVSKLSYADVVYFFLNASHDVNVSGTVKSGEVVLHANEWVSVDRENLVNIILTFSSYYSSIFQVE